MIDDNSKSNLTLTPEKKRVLELMLKKKGLLNSSQSDRASIPLKSKTNQFVLSNAQQRLWFLQQITPDPQAYSFCNRIDLRGELNVSALTFAFQELINRHEILRTSYHQEQGVAYQKIHSVLVPNISMTDISNISKEEKELALDNIIKQEYSKSFDLKKIPLMRLSLVKLFNNHHVLVQNIHHIVYDGWSLSVMFSEIKSIYESYISGNKSNLAPVSIQYADYSEWARARNESQEIKAQLDYWKNLLSGELAVLELPLDKVRPEVQSFTGATYPLVIPHSLCHSLKTLATENKCTLFMVLLTGFNILLHRYTGEEDIIIGSPVANRDNPQLESLIGFFVNSIVFRNTLKNDPNVKILLGLVRDNVLAAYSNHQVPFDLIVDELDIVRNVSNNPVFQVMFAFQTETALPKKIADLDFNFQEIDNGTSLFDLTLNLVESEGQVSGNLEYSSALFGAETIARMSEHYLIILNSMIEQPDSKVSQLKMLTDRESELLLNTWNATDADYKSLQSIHHEFEQQVVLHKNSIAVYDKNGSVTYQELNEQANRLARFLIEKGVGSGHIVGVSLQRSCEMIVSILAILKAGAAYLPLDPDYPKTRLSFLLKDSNASNLITEYSLSTIFSEFTGNVFCLDEITNGLSRISSENINAEISSDVLAYVIYTSGSTGEPKGVMVNHKSLVNSTHARINYYSNKLEKFLLLSSFSFDSSIAGIFWTLCQGGELHLPKQGVEKDPQLVASALSNAKATHMLSLPSVYSLLLSIADQAQLKFLNTIIVAGEACSSSIVAQHYNILPQALLYNEYGPTEGTVWSSVYQVTINDRLRAVPIGKPIGNVKVFILDKNFQPVPVGAIAELYISGAGLALGYLNRDELTKERFIEVPINNIKTRMYKTGDLVKYLPDGNIMFCGRIDHQVKVRGYRIELGEIESAISRIKNVNEAAVIAQKQNNQLKPVCASELAKDTRLLAEKLSELEKSNKLELEKLWLELE